MDKKSIENTQNEMRRTEKPGTPKATGPQLLVVEDGGRRIPQSRSGTSSPAALRQANRTPLRVRPADKDRAATQSPPGRTRRLLFPVPQPPSPGCTLCQGCARCQGLPASPPAPSQDPRPGLKLSSASPRASQTGPHCVSGFRFNINKIIRAIKHVWFKPMSQLQTEHGG